ncbi:MAG TPA: RyR domain-containing protein [Anaeromyxobacteraceae bacterium]|nr:RyR domain-containing protein [Anaeromyxobacteraceae bacterium]
MPAAPYRPNPIDTKAVKLPEEVARVGEKLARNAHEVWARGRLAEGWRLGPRRDEERKLHPSLVPYEELPEEEKAYDRATVLESLKALCALGFRILGPGGEDGER